MGWEGTGSCQFNLYQSHVTLSIDSIQSQVSLPRTWGDSADRVSKSESRTRPAFGLKPLFLISL